jgi:hypothetical protein
MLARYFLFFGLGVCAGVSAARDNPEYDQCLLMHLKNAKLDIASQLITRACYENYVEANFQRKSELRRNACLLEHLPGIESADAVARVDEACKRRGDHK